MIDLEGKKLLLYIAKILRIETFRQSCSAIRIQRWWKGYAIRKKYGEQIASFRNKKVDSEPENKAQGRNEVKIQEDMKVEEITETPVVAPPPVKKAVTSQKKATAKAATASKPLRSAASER